MTNMWRISTAANYNTFYKVTPVTHPTRRLLYLSTFKLILIGFETDFKVIA